MARLIGIQHRVKKTTQGEARPTMVAIKTGDSVREFKLATETDELDFVLGRFPTTWRNAALEEDLTKFPKHHVDQGDKGKPTKVPAAYEGLGSDDVVSMYLGGSGDRLAYALSRRGEEIGAAVWRTPPFRLVAKSAKEKEEAHRRLIEFYERTPQHFYPVGPRDRDFIAVSEAFRSFKDSQKDRMACAQRLRQRTIGSIFLSPDGKYPEGLIEDLYDERSASDAILTVVEKEEARRESEMKKLVHKLDVWQEIFGPIEGCGEVLAAGIISAIGNIRRFRSYEDITEVARLREEVKRLEVVACRTEDADKIERADGENHFIRTGRIAKWKKEHGKEKEARALYETLALMQQISKIQKRYQSRIRAYAGVHVLGLDGKKMPPGTIRRSGDAMFARRRHGVVANWSPQLRQSLYNLSKQWSYRKDSPWGLRLRENKKQDRLRHPEIVTETTAEGPKKRFTDGHIHNRGNWRTMTEFITFVAEKWMQLEESKSE
ncbi:MAG: hypothetical protein WD851_15850 [Pirellulales bacterium]